MILITFLLSFLVQGVNANSPRFYDHQVRDLSGKEVSLQKYVGKVTLVVNTA